MTVVDRAPAAPDATLVKARWVRKPDREWAEACDALLMEFGVVSSAHEYERRTTAKRRVLRLRDLMVDLKLHEAWQLVTHTERKGAGWTWHLEYSGDRDGRVDKQHPAA